MRLLRLFSLLTSSVLLVTCLLYINYSSASQHHTSSTYKHSAAGSLRALFSFGNAGSLFTPSAIISLTDENSTFFAARPAAFGPALPNTGLSGQIWIGSGFVDDMLQRRGLDPYGEGELGCGDIEGWPDRDWLVRRPSEDSHSELPSHRQLKRYVDTGASELDISLLESAPRRSREDSNTIPTHNDGTDDSFHYPLESTDITKSNMFKTTMAHPSAQHADIQSMQESAEISGKVVLLSRGGCGFSEKVKWGQRRGATAVIVADNIPGGQLVRMYARGETENITIPSIFTSHTTAHLLSSLLPSDYYYPDQYQSNSNHYTSDRQKTKLNYLAIPDDGDAGHSKLRRAEMDGISSSKSFAASSDSIARSSYKGEYHSSHDKLRDWLSFLWTAIHEDSHKGNEHPIHNNARPTPALVDGKDQPHTLSAGSLKASEPSQDSFIIGVHDWRDPDVALKPSESSEGTRTSTRSSKTAASTSSPSDSQNRVKGGIITPGSGEYGEVGQLTGHVTTHAHSDVSQSDKSSLNSASRPGLDVDIKDRLHRIPQPQLDDDAALSTEPHKGLWVTLTPTQLNTSPFFNTLFVLVVSPLITLAAVYTMLLVRSRIRRRRWRAPKSVVERLPVRVYHARSTQSSPETQPIVPPATSELSSTPLLVDHELTAASTQDVAGASSSIPIPTNGGSLGFEGGAKEKIETGLASWRRKYGGKQVECVVCLEEYVDGVSKVMSLPCGHEFHADCM